jgi:oligopeptide/dipeptide ABC transporter ATP-binding protein
VPDAARRLDEYPHQLSGGLRQRIMIAIALACDPDLLIADEPTTALDVTIQAQILQLLKDIRQQREMGIIMITHDLGIIFDFCDRVAVMYCGEIVETAPVQGLFARPLHPYTAGLIEALPRLSDSGRRLVAIEGMVPDAGQMPSGCFFHPRCKKVMPVCRQKHPLLKRTADGRQVRCFLYEDNEQAGTQR